MFAAISRYDEADDAPSPEPPQRLERGDGAAEITFVRRDGVNALSHLYQRTPCRVLFPQPSPGDPPLAALLTTSGGLAGGDRLRLAVTVAADAAATTTTAAAEKVYRSLGPDAQVGVALRVEAGGWLEWLPQETILFDGARLHRRVGADLAPGARLLAAETIVLGRTARGERFMRGLLHEAWRIRRDGRLVWADALRLEDDIAARLDGPGFGGAVAVATAAYVGDDAPALLPLARSLAEDGDCRGGASLVNGVLLARFIGERADMLRRALMRYLAGVRHAAAGFPAALPRLWHS
jgi:urease accessory protein